MGVAEADAKQDQAKRDMAGVLAGQESHDLAFDAKLYAPETKVVTEAEMAQIKAAKKKKADDKKAAEEAEQTALVATRKKKQAIRGGPGQGEGPGKGEESQ